MTPDEARLRELAEAAFELGEIVAAMGEPAWYDDDSATMGGRIPDVDAAFIAAANPATIIALIDALSAERERADRAVGLLRRIADDDTFDGPSSARLFLATQKAEGA